MDEPGTEARGNRAGLHDVGTSVGSGARGFRGRDSGGQASLRRLGGGLLVLLLTWGPSVLAASHCFVCERPLQREVFIVTDRWENQQREVCGDCVATTGRCSVCRLPVAAGGREVGDGRVVCPRHLSLVVFGEAEALQLVREARVEMDRRFARFTEFARDSVGLEMVDQVHMDQLLNSPGFERQCPSVLGYTRSERTASGQWRHSLRLLSALPRSALVGVYLHELAHTWVNENVPADRRLLKDAEEGFCELVAYCVLEDRGETEELQRILANNYTRGQIELFLAAYRTYDFQRVLDWMRWGQSPALAADDPERIRDVVPPRPRAVEKLVPQRRGVPRGPESLTLQSLLGNGAEAVALVNGTPLMAGDTGRVLVGTNRVGVRCLRVGPRSVVLQLPEQGVEVELSLPLPADDDPW